MGGSNLSKDPPGRQAKFPLVFEIPLSGSASSLDHSWTETMIGPRFQQCPGLRDDQKIGFIVDVARCDPEQPDAD